MRVWNVLSGQRVSQFGSEELVVCDLEWCGGNGRLLTACVDGTLRLWDRKTGQEQKRLLGHTGAVRSVSLSLDKQVIASTGDDGMICIWPAIENESHAENGTESELEAEAEAEAAAELEAAELEAAGFEAAGLEGETESATESEDGNHVAESRGSR